MSVPDETVSRCSIPLFIDLQLTGSSIRKGERIKPRGTCRWLYLNRIFGTCLNKVRCYRRIWFSNEHVHHIANFHSQSPFLIDCLFIFNLKLHPFVLAKGNLAEVNWNFQISAKCSFFLLQFFKYVINGNTNMSCFYIN